MDKFPFAVSLRCKAMWKQEVDLKRYNAWNRKLFRSSTSNRLNHLAAVHHQTGLSMQMMTAKLVLMANPVCHFLLQEEKSIISFGCDWSEQNTHIQNIFCFVCTQLGIQCIFSLWWGCHFNWTNYGKSSQSPSLRKENEQGIKWLFLPRYNPI